MPLIGLALNTELTLDPQVLPTGDHPANYKDPGKIEQWYADRRAKLAVEAAAWVTCGRISQVGLCIATQPDPLGPIVPVTTLFKGATAAVSAFNEIRKLFEPSGGDPLRNCRFVGSGVRENLRRLLFQVAVDGAADELALLPEVWKVTHHDNWSQVFDPYCVAVPAEARGSVDQSRLASYMGVETPSDWADPQERAALAVGLAMALRL